MSTNLAPSTGHPAESPRPYPSWMGILILLIIVALLLGFWIYSERLIESLEHQAARISELQTRLDDLGGIIGGRGYSSVTLSARPEFSETSVRVFINKEQNRAAALISHPPLRQNHLLVLWVLESSRVVSKATVPATIPEHRQTVWSFVNLPAEGMATFVLTLEAAADAAHPSDSIVAEAPGGIVP